MRKYVLSVDSRGITGLEIEKMLDNPDVYIMNVEDADKAETVVRKRLRDYSLIVWTVNYGEEYVYDVIKDIIGLEAFNGIPLLIVSDYSDKGDNIRDVEKGAVYHIKRPYDKDALTKEISDILGITTEKPFDTIRDSLVTFTFEDILNKEIKSASRGEYSLSILLISLRKKDAASKKKTALDAAEVLGAVFRRRFRDTDVVIYAESGEVMLLLPFVSESGLETVRNKINELLATHSAIKKAIDGYDIYMASVTYPADGKAREELLDKLSERISGEFNT